MRVRSARPGLCPTARAPGRNRGRSSATDAGKRPVARLDCRGPRRRPGSSARDGVLSDPPQRAAAARPEAGRPAVATFPAHFRPGLSTCHEEPAGRPGGEPESLAGGPAAPDVCPHHKLAGAHLRGRTAVHRSHSALLDDTPCHEDHRRRPGPGRPTRGQRRRFSDREVKPLDQVRRELGLDRQPAPNSPEPSDAVAWARPLTTLTPRESHHRRGQRGAVPADILREPPSRAAPHRRFYRLALRGKPAVSRKTSC